MAHADILQEIIQETCELVKRSAHPRKRTLRLSPEVAGQLEGLIVGVTSPPTEAVQVEAVAETPAVAVAPVQEDVPPSPVAVARAVAAPDNVEDALARLCIQVEACRKCGLGDTRQKTVFGEGSSHADLVFVGEAPGASEDRCGQPFVGRAGQLLTDIIVKGMRLQRQDVYICNVLKCHPPENRDPNPAEVKCCEPYLLAQLDLLKPKVICALGRCAAQTLLRSSESTGRLRGRWHNYHGIPLRVTYHPAYLLRTPSEKRKTWEDIQEVMKVLSGEVTPQL